MRRIYEILVTEHYEEYPQMVLLAGPRQVGKTTVSLSAKKFSKQFYYFNWDVQAHRHLISKGADAVAESMGLHQLHKIKPVVVFDEIHKYTKWKSFIKGFFDLYRGKVFIIITGSAKLDVFKRGGDSLMGRYFLYHVHPLSVAECVQKRLNRSGIQEPKPISATQWQNLLRYGGFPEPFLKAQQRFSNRWQQLRHEQLFREDIRDLSRVQELGQLEVFARILKEQAGQLCVYNNIANKVNVTVETISRWLKLLEGFYYCFSVKPWSKNITRTLLKTPKVYLWDWSEVDDVGAKAENFIASHLLKAVHFWNDRGLGHYDLFFIRDKDKREVDFLVTKNDKPWFLVEVKNSDGAKLNPHLAVFQKQTGAQHAFQVVLDLPYVDKDCFSAKSPIVVPARTFLSQLV